MTAFRSTCHSQGIGVAPIAEDGKPVDGFWNDVREDEMWNEDSDCAQAGQAIGAITDVPPAAALVKSMMEELVVALQMMGKMGEQVPSGAKFTIEVPADAPLTLANL